VLLERDDSLSTLNGLLEGVRSEGRLVVVGGRSSRVLRAWRIA